MKIEYEFDDEVYEFEPEWTSLHEALVKILTKNVQELHKGLYNADGAYQMAMYVVNELDTIDTLCENLEDELYEYYYDEAEREYQNGLEIERAERDWYGTKSDVLGF